MTSYSDDFALQFDAAEEVVRIWLIIHGERQEPPLLLTFSKVKVLGLDNAAAFLGLKLVARSPAMRELFGFSIDPDKPLKDQV